MRIVITGGGTGGHVYPAIATAGGIKSRWPQAEILFIGTSNRTEAKAVPAAGYPIRFIKAAGFSASPLKLAAFLACNSLGFVQAFSILTRFKPVLAVGSGGFVSAPVLAAAGALGIPYVVLEQNVVPGKVNRLMARGADRILTSFEGSLGFFPPEKTVVTGNPIRPEITSRRREEGMEALKLTPRAFNLLITGASQGARSINSSVVKALPAWKEMDWNVLHLTGPDNFDGVKGAAEPHLPGMRGEYRCMAYTEDMASLLSVADLVVARSGATTLSEIFARGLPSILVPYPHHADNHGLKNARWVEEKGAGVVVLDKEAEEKLAALVIEMAASPEKLREMGGRSKTLGRPDALKSIIDEIARVLCI